MVARSTFPIIPMPQLFRPANLFLILTYLTLSGVPFVPLLLGHAVDQPAQLLAIEFISWVLIWAACKRPAWFHVLLIPAFLAMPTEIYLQTFYGQGISTHHLGIIAETSPVESVEFLGKKVWLLLAIIIGVILWWWLTWRIARKARCFDWVDVSRWVALGVLALGLAVWFYGDQIGINSPPPATSGKKIAHVTGANATASAVSGTTDDGDDDEDDEQGDEEGDEDDEELSSGSVVSGSIAYIAASSGGASVSASVIAAKKASVGTSASESVSAWPKLPHWAKISFDLKLFAHSWPFGLMARGIDFWKERKILGELSEKNKYFKFGAHQNHPNTTPEIVVMVIGESSRYDRWSLNGYGRETNPLLKREGNLVSFSDVVTAVAATRLAVPVLISRKPARQSLKDGFFEKSFLTAFKEAGFKTYWLSNQISFGHFDTPVSVFAKEANVIQFMNLGGFTDDSNFDQILLDPLKNAIADPAPKKLIVLHTLGSHWNYSHRYPKQFDKWQPSLFGVNKPAYTNTKIKPQLNNSYDNSILYTDWFLSQVIGVLKSANQLTSMLYVADHGQTLYDGTCNLAFHGHNTQHEFHIPAFMWYSKLYETTYPNKVERLLHNKKAKIATENVFHSLLDMGDIRYGTERLEWSVLNPKFQTHKRYVDSYGWSDYDNSTFKGDCREVIDKNKPLKQEK
jgi:glucan phosphoethanolaminetransferase (alkaline phosphatase superfamily)